MSKQQLHDYYYPHIYGDFLRNAEGHQLEVLHDDGLYRHLRFKTPGSLLYHFDIITWPGSLVTKGDIADGYVFSRDVDMLDFFDEGQPGGHINPSYWAEKLARGSRDVEEFSQKEFRSWLRERLREASEWDEFQIAPDQVEELVNRRARLVESVDDAIALLDECNIPWDYEDPQAWYDYRYHFILTLHAILWGAKKYHEHVKALEEVKA